MADAGNIVTAPTTLKPLDSYGNLHRGLTAVTILGFISFVTSFALFLRLAYRLITRRRRSQSRGRTNQFTILIFNLICADLQQSVAFLLNCKWLVDNGIMSGSATCWAQGWFVSVGDMGSGLFTLAIAAHSFMDIVFDYRLKHHAFLGVIAGMWTFNYVCPIIGIGMHPTNFYTRAGAWCWIDGKYIDERLWLHYFWVIIAEFGTVIIYVAIFVILERRVKGAFYTDTDMAVRAKSAAKMIVAYPIVYVVCTLPLVKARLTSMADKPVSFLELTIAGAMITSNGWLDVLLYTLTRRGVLFGPDIEDEQTRILETFRIRPDQAYGTTTVIEANKSRQSQHGRKRSQPHIHRDGSGGDDLSRSGSTEELWSTPLSAVKAETTVVVSTNTVEMDRLEQDQRRPSLESRSQKSGRKIKSISLPSSR